MRFLENVEGARNGRKHRLELLITRALAARGACRELDERVHVFSNALRLAGYPIGLNACATTSGTDSDDAFCGALLVSARRCMAFGAGAAGNNGSFGNWSDSPTAARDEQEHAGHACSVSARI